MARRRMRLLLISTLVSAAFLMTAPPARADATAFIGTNSAPTTRQVRGFAIGASLLILGFEFEYADTREDVTQAAPELKTWMGNVMAQTPGAGLQLYATLGAGVFRENLDVQQTTNIGMNTGGGLKFPLAGPLRVRFDYRVFTLRGTSLTGSTQRVYVGANLAF